MARAGLDEEARLLERVAQYRQEYSSSRAAILKDERETRHANGEVYFAGTWVPRARAADIARALERRECLTFVEIVVLMVVLIAVAVGESELFAFLFLP